MKLANITIGLLAIVISGCSCSSEGSSSSPSTTPEREVVYELTCWNGGKVVYHLITTDPNPFGSSNHVVVQSNISGRYVRSTDGIACISVPRYKDELDQPKSTKEPSDQYDDDVRLNDY